MLALLNHRNIAAIHGLEVSCHSFQERRDASLLFATHDRTQGVAARAFGLEVTGI